MFWCGKVQQCNHFLRFLRRWMVMMPVVEKGKGSLASRFRTSEQVAQLNI